ncbi:MAG: class I SAM-dependent methyltransferase [Kofleriaceae bacterium]|nr:class I SAM-dependent methyltransferase [Kofleriaceae bacterium]
MSDDKSDDKTDVKVQEQSENLRNRVRKTYKHLKKWSRREKVHCFRLYDRDIPEIPLVIDWYQGRLHVAEFAKRHSEDESRHGEEWMRTVVAPMAEDLGVASADIYYKVRNRQRGQAQYQAKGAQYNRIEVEEGGHRFLVNLVDYLDTGLFLDHRRTRAMVAAESEGKSLLNLYCYTGSFQVHAAGAGAAISVGIDLSATYLEWARANLELNGFEAARHRLIRGDVQEELQHLVSSGEKFDIVVVDPPTFSNSKRLEGVFDVQRDHMAVLQSVHGLLAQSGVVYFSTNHRRFKFEEEEASALFEIQEITKKTLPTDYRDKKIHRCWRLVKR